MIRKRPWIAQQHWGDVLFLHWHVPINLIEPLIPEPFTLDTYNGKAWISAVIFSATKSRFRFMPTCSAYRSFLQMNIRTYVKFNNTGEKGVYFFSLNANDSLVVNGARTFCNLPFHRSSAKLHKQNKVLTFTMNELGAIQYKPSEIPISESNFNEFLTERYCIWHLKGNKIIKIPISHSRWQLKEVHVIHTQIDFDKLIPHQLRGILDNTHVSAQYSSFKKTKLYPYEVCGIYMPPVL